MRVGVRVRVRVGVRVRARVRVRVRVRARVRVGVGVGVGAPYACEPSADRARIQSDGACGGSRGARAPNTAGGR